MAASSEICKVLLAGEWRHAKAEGTFRAANPRTKAPLEAEYPVSSLDDVESAVQAGWEAGRELRALNAARRSDFLERYAARIDARADDLVEAAHEETALPKAPRLLEVELPRTSNQLRQAAAAALDGSWTEATIDTQTGIRSRFGPLAGPVAVFGPNNFPFAFNGISGGDFAAAIAAGNAVIAKANTSHPTTTRILGEEAFEAVREAGLPAATVQLLYRIDHETGKRLVSHPLIGATGYTGSRAAGLTLKTAADAAGKPIYLELSSVNPVVILPAAIRERGEAIAGEFQTSCLMGAGQFCTNPGVVVLLRSGETEGFIQQVCAGFEKAPVGTLLGGRVEEGLARAVRDLVAAGAEVLTGGEPGGGEGFSYRNTVLRVSGAQFLEKPLELQGEAFGNSTLLVIAEDGKELENVVGSFEGNLTGCIYSHSGGEDDDVYGRVAPVLQARVGRLLNDKMPTGVAVSAAMNHGGPYPATGHPGFTAVGIPAALRRFAKLECYDNVREGKAAPRAPGPESHRQALALHRRPVEPGRRGVAEPGTDSATAARQEPRFPVKRLERKGRARLPPSRGRIPLLRLGRSLALPAPPPTSRALPGAARLRSARQWGASVAVDDRLVGRVHPEDVVDLAIDVVDLGDAAAVHRGLEGAISRRHADDGGRRRLSHLGVPGAVVTYHDRRPQVTDPETAVDRCRRQRATADHDE